MTQLCAAPPAPVTVPATKVEQALGAWRAIPEPIEKYLFLRRLQRDNPTAFYKLLLANTEEILPYVYTPTVGQACQEYHLLNVPTYGVYLRATDKGHFLEKLQQYPEQDIRVIVITDGERILGLGDLGAGGMGISEGKSLLYTAAAGVPPHQLLPVCLDVGTNNKALLEDPHYKGLRQPRITGKAYFDLVEEFVVALKAWRPHVLLQWEDFANHTAFELLESYRTQLCCFNDDIQGTACITLAGLLSALRASGKPLSEQRVLFYGAGEAGTGIGELIAIALEHRYSMTREEGRKRCFFMDSKGLVCASRSDLQHHKKPFAHDVPPCKTLLEAIVQLKPTAIIGVSTIAGAFSQEVIEAMAALNEHPIIFPLSNPTSKSECTYRQAFDGTGGKVLFASGSPFPPIDDAPDGRTHWPAQANNAYIFPAVGHAAVLCESREISDEVFLVAAEALASMTTLEELEEGLLFPRFRTIKDVSAKLAAATAEFMVSRGLGTEPRDFAQVLAMVGAGGAVTKLAKWEAYVRAHMYDPSGPKL